MSDTRVSRVHRMPFGAATLPGGARFRLWAPTASRVELLCGESPERAPLPMERKAEGFHELLVEDVADGERYRFRIDGGTTVPDPASRYQPQDVHGPSQLVDPASFPWPDGDWRGRPWEESVFYELHVGSLTRDGSFDGVLRRLDHLADVGVTALELMPVADFPGRRNWGYDGVLPFAPDAAYGTPDGLKRLVAAAHERELMVFLDVVYNHFGPEGNYLHLYARPFFKDGAQTPWGDAIDFDGPASRHVRDFFIHNALYWLEEFHLDGLRLDAVHAIHDESEPDFLEELARAVREGPGAERHVHLVLENVDNEAHRLDRDPSGAARSFDAQWNDDVHHALHCLLTGEDEGYYADFASSPGRHLARGLAEGFSYQGEPSGFRGAERGEPSAHLPPTSFVNFLQNHDQIGNRAFGERLTVLAGERPLRAAVAILLLAPSPPLLFMGEEWGSRSPFPFFCDFGPDLARAVTEGRRREFARFAQFRDPATRDRIPDPGAAATFDSAVLDWERRDGRDRRWLELYRDLLALRHAEIVPRLAGCPGGAGRHRMIGERAFEVDWTLGDGSRLTLLANADEAAAPAPGRRGRVIFDLPGPDDGPRAADSLGPWSVVWTLSES